MSMVNHVIEKYVVTLLRSYFMSQLRYRVVPFLCSRVVTLFESSVIRRFGCCYGLACHPLAPNGLVREFRRWDSYLMPAPGRKGHIDWLCWARIGILV